MSKYKADKAYSDSSYCQQFFIILFYILPLTKMLCEQNSQLGKNSTSKNPIRYILIRQHLSNSYNPDQWAQIKAHKPTAFCLIQHKIFTHLFNSEELFNKFFQLFYENHTKIYQWYLLSRENHSEIKQYIYKSLLRKTIQTYRSEMRKNMIEVKRQKPQQRNNKGHIKTSFQTIQSTKREKMGNTKNQQRKHQINDLTHQIFKFMSDKPKTASLLIWEKPWSYHKANKKGLGRQQINSCSFNIGEKLIQQNRTLKEKPKNVLNSECQQLLKKIDPHLSFKHDFHDLFVQTFQACDGYRYIFYDYEKHMKGLSEKDKYNMFIRSQKKSKTPQINNRISDSNEEKQKENIKEIKSLQFERSKTSFQFSYFLNDGNMNNQGKKTSKVIFRRTRSQNRNIGKFIRK